MTDPKTEGYWVIGVSEKAVSNPINSRHILRYFFIPFHPLDATYRRSIQVLGFRQRVKESIGSFDLAP